MHFNQICIDRRICFLNGEILNPWQNLPFSTSRSKMNLLHLRLISKGVGHHFGSSNGARLGFHSKTSPVRRRPPAILNPIVDLFHRISPVGEPEASVVPILDKWIEERRELRRDQLHSFIKSLRRYRRYNHALQISLWMTDKRYFKLTNQDVAIRLDLIRKVHGIEAAEKFFNNVDRKFRTLEVYGSLLNCYASDHQVEKTEEVMQTMRELGLFRSQLSYNVVLRLYQETGNFEKLRELVKEMERKGIPSDKFTYGTQINAYAALQDSEGINQTIQKAESHSRTFLDWRFYCGAANAYLKLGQFDKALGLLKKCEDLMLRLKRKAYDDGEAYNFLVSCYTAMGKKDEVLRLWEQYKEQEKVFTKGYVWMVAAIIKLDDIETAEKIFEEWESSNSLVFDIRLPNLLLGAYGNKGAIVKAEGIIDRIVAKEKKPDEVTWYLLSRAHLDHGQAERAVEAMKEAIVISKKGWKPAKASVVFCLKLLKDEDIKRAEEFIELLRKKDVISGDIQEWLGDASVENPDLSSSIQAAFDALDGGREVFESSDVQ